MQHCLLMLFAMTSPLWELLMVSASFSAGSVESYLAKTVVYFCRAFQRLQFPNPHAKTSQTSVPCVESSALKR